MKTDTLFYQLFKEFPSIFFELIGKPETNLNAYEFTAPEVKQKAFRLDGLFSTLEGFANEPLYFVEVQFYKEDDFYDRLFAGTFLYFAQYNPPNPEWYAIVIYNRRSTETPPHPRYQHLMQHHVRCIYLDEFGEVGEQSLGLGIIKLVVETTRNTSEVALNLIAKARAQLTDAAIQQQVIELIETIVLYKFPNLSREEIEAMLRLDELKQTRVYQEALAEGIEQGKLEAKLEMVPVLIQLGLSVEEISQRLGLDVETVRARIQ